jgi:hypothetical protein
MLRSEDLSHNPGCWGCVYVFTFVKMGDLQSLFMYDDFDFHVLFAAFMKTKCGIDDLARLACTCKLSRAWVREQLVQCNNDQISDFLWYMECTGLEDGFAKKKKGPLVAGRLLYIKHYFLNLQIPNGTFYQLVGFFDLNRCNAFGEPAGEWITWWASRKLSDVKADLFGKRFTEKPRRYGYACFPIFDEQIRRVLTPEKFVSEDKELLKKARLDKK